MLVITNELNESTNALTGRESERSMATQPKESYL